MPWRLPPECAFGILRWMTSCRLLRRIALCSRPADTFSHAMSFVGLTKFVSRNNFRLKVPICSPCTLVMRNPSTSRMRACFVWAWFARLVCQMWESCMDCMRNLCRHLGSCRSYERGTWTTLRVRVSCSFCAGAAKFTIYVCVQKNILETGVTAKTGTTSPSSS